MRILVGALVTSILVILPLDSLDARAPAKAGQAGAGKAHDRAGGPRARAPKAALPRAASKAAFKAARGQAPGSKSPSTRVAARGRPAKALAKRCRARQDLRVPLSYLQGGAVWIPAEARCGGKFPVIVLLHGNNTDKETVKSIGGGRRLDRWARRYLNGALIEPVVLAEPIHFGACASDERRNGLPYLFTGAFDFKEYRRRLEAALAKHGVKAKTWSFIGHSGAACCLTMGMFALKEAWPEIKVWGSADGCYRDTLQAAAIEQQFGQSRTKVFNACRGFPAYQGYRAYERTLLSKDAQTVKCDSTYYKQCRRHPTRPWYSFTTQFTGPEKHGKVLEELFKTIVFHEFPSARRVAAQKKAAERQELLAARRRARVLEAKRPRRGASRQARAPGETRGSRGPAEVKPAARPGSLASRDD